MPDRDANFRGYLRQEVDDAGQHYEQARVRFFALMGEPQFQPGPAVLEATEAFSEALRMYVGALRRLAHYSAHQGRRGSRKPLAAHA